MTYLAGLVATIFRLPYKDDGKKDQIKKNKNPVVVPLEFVLVGLFHLNVFLIEKIKPRRVNMTITT